MNDKDFDIGGVVQTRPMHSFAKAVLESKSCYWLMEAAADAMLVADGEGWIVLANPAAERLFGYGQEEFARLAIEDLIPQRFRAGHQAKRVDYAAHPGRRTMGKDFDIYALRSDGGEFAADVSLSPIDDGLVLVTVYDISRRKQAEESLQRQHAELNAAYQRLQELQGQLVQSEKMASIGQLAAGVAHEINNPIGYIYSNLGSLRAYIGEVLGLLEAYEKVEASLPEGDELAAIRAMKRRIELDFIKQDIPSLVGESSEGAARVKKIVQDLKDFSHMGAADQWQWADLHQGLDSTVNIVWNEVKYKAELVKEYGQLPEIECLPCQLNQVFMNLLVNGAHAIDGKGAICIRTGRDGDRVWVEFADTGQGIAPEHLAKIFEPFFTTKPVGQGTGLGLSVSYSIIQKHNGRIEVASELGRGTVFRIWLPVKQERGVEAAASAHSPQGAPS